MILIKSFFLVLIIYEILKYFKFFKLLKKNIDIYNKLIELFYKKDHEKITKEQVIKYSKDLFYISIKIFLLLCIVIAIIYIVGIFDDGFVYFILTFKGFIVLSTFYIVYSIIRKYINDKL